MQAVTTSDRDRRSAPEARPAGRVHERTCVGCGKTGAPRDLVRVVLGPPGEGGAPVAVDLAAGAHGRGAHVHPSPACLAGAAKSGLARSFKAKVATSAADLGAQIVAASDRRITGLLAGANRARMLAIGADAAEEAAQQGAAVVFACDAGTVLGRTVFEATIAGGRGVAWKDKATLGAVLGKVEVAVVAVKNETVAEEIAHVRAIGEAAAGAVKLATSRGEACRSREVR